MNQEREGRTHLRNSEWHLPVESGKRKKKGKEKRKEKKKMK